MLKRAATLNLAEASADFPAGSAQQSEGVNVGNIESALNDRIDRRARQQAKALNGKLAAEVKRLRTRVASLGEEINGLKAQMKSLAKSRGAGTALAADGPSTEIRISPKLIASLRKKLGVSQADMAKLAGVSPQAIYLWESGRTNPRPDAKAKIAALRKLGRREAKRLLVERA